MSFFITLIVMSNLLSLYIYAYRTHLIPKAMTSNEKINLGLYGTTPTLKSPTKNQEHLIEAMVFGSKMLLLIGVLGTVYFLFGTVVDYMTNRDYTFQESAHMLKTNVLTGFMQLVMSLTTISMLYVVTKKKA